MTPPRQVLPDTTVMITRRCLGRMFLLRPSKLTNDVFRFLLAVAAERHGVEVHAFCVLSNHFHCVVTDRKGTLPAFEQLLDSLVARALNALHGRWESFWAPGSYSAVTLATPEDVLAKTGYVVANPAGLVRDSASHAVPNALPTSSRPEGRQRSASAPSHQRRASSTLRQSGTGGSVSRKARP